MRQFEAVIQEIRYTQNRRVTAWIACQPAAIPAPGQYVLTWSPGDNAAALASVLFPAEIGENGFLASPPIPESWQPGTNLQMRGPLGRGFQLPNNTHRLILAAFTETVERLLPVMNLAIQADIAVALYTIQPATGLPAAVEIYPISDLPAAINWADVLMLDVSIEDLARLRSWLGLKQREHLPCPAQALVLTSMPCGGLAECGACFVPGHRNWMQACQDGPVFDLKALDW